MKALDVCLLSALVTCVVGCSSLEKPHLTTATKSGSFGEIAFANTVKPLIEKRCVWCHSNRKPLAGLNFQDRTSVQNPEMMFVVPGKPDQSRIYNAVTRENAHPRVMPGDGWGITGEQKAALKKWVESGAPWPEGKAGQIRHRRFQVDREDYL